MEAKVENILRYKFISSKSPSLQSIYILAFGLILPGKALVEKSKCLSHYSGLAEVFFLFTQNELGLMQLT